MKEIIYKLPPEFLDKIKSIYPAIYPKICETFLYNKEQTFRINYLKTDLVNLRQLLNKEQIRYRELSWPKGSFILKSDLRQLQKSFIYNEGLVYVQNISSMIPPIILNPKTGEKILDLCASPGAKTSQIASLAGKDIELVAVEKQQIRYQKLLATLKIQGADFAKTYLLDGVLIKKQFPEYFDKILLDAPCTSEANFFVHNPGSFKYWDQKKVKEMSRRQKNLISSAVYSLKAGGELIYSTCTFSPEENEEVINWALNKFKDIEIAPVETAITNIMKGLTRWQDKRFSDSLKLALRILPNEFMEGFFIAKLRKL